MELPEAIELQGKVGAALAQVDAALKAGAGDGGWNTTSANALSMAEANLQRAQALASDLVTDIEAALKASEAVDEHAVDMLVGQIHSRLLEDDRTRRAFFTIEYRDGALVLHPFTLPGSYRMRMELLPDEQQF